jgi:hypothetical protein
LGRQIAAQGRESFVADFRKNIGKTKGHAQRPPPTPLKIFFAIIFFVVCFAVIISAGLFPVCAVLIIFVTGIYLVSLHLATRKFEKWVDMLISKYAAYVARGGR